MAADRVAGACALPRTQAPASADPDASARVEACVELRPADAAIDTTSRSILRGRALLRKAGVRILIAASSSSLVLSPKLSSAAPPNRASRATIAFLESDRPDRPRAGDAYGDVPIVPTWLHAAESVAHATACRIGGLPTQGPGAAGDASGLRQPFSARAQEPFASVGSAAGSHGGCRTNHRVSRLFVRLRQGDDSGVNHFRRGGPAPPA